MKKGKSKKNNTFLTKQSLLKNMTLKKGYIPGGYAEEVIDKIILGTSSEYMEIKEKLRLIQNATKSINIEVRDEACVFLLKLYDELYDGVKGKRNWEKGGKRKRVAMELLEFLHKDKKACTSGGSKKKKRRKSISKNTKHKTKRRKKSKRN
tara:strand:+ start:523 stop:975 length:453 start_codon:yes stop_codon:yes gene_type:complete